MKVFQKQGGREGGSNLRLYHFFGVDVANDHMTFLSSDMEISLYQPNLAGQLGSTTQRTAAVYNHSWSCGGGRSQLTPNTT